MLLDQGAFPVSPQNLVDGDGAAVPAIDTPRSIKQEDEESAERDEL
jgi:hypothetical protein